MFEVLYLANDLSRYHHGAFIDEKLDLSFIQNILIFDCPVESYRIKSLYLQTMQMLQICHHIFVHVVSESLCMQSFIGIYYLIYVKNKKKSKDFSF